MKKNSIILSLTASLALAAFANAEPLFNAGGFDTDTTSNFTITNGTSTDLFWDSTNGGRYKQISGTSVISIYNAPAAKDFADYTVNTSYVANSRGGISHIGLVARYRNETNFYSGRIAAGPNDNSWKLEIYRFGGSGNSLLSSSTTFTFEKATDNLYHGHFEFSVVGSNISLKFYDDSTNSTIPLASITATDTNFTSGTAGFRSTVNGAVLAYTEFSITTSSIPEPSTIAALSGILALIAALFVRSRR